MANIDGTPGDDGLVGTTGDDTINAYGGNDVVNGLAGNDTIDGGDDHDLLNGQQGNDTIYGGNGDDLIRSGTGDDYADGGSGYDRVSYASVGSDALTSGVTVSLALQDSWQDTGGGGIDYLVGFEHLTGTRFDDTLTGDDNDNWLWGGFDPATGIGGNDKISGGGGNDLIQVALGSSVVDGGTGTDTLTFFGDDIGVPTGVAFDLALQGTTQVTSFGNVTATNFENLSGTIFDDSLSGDGNDNVLAGDQGNDTLLGGAGNDTLYGDGEINVDTHGLGYSGPVTTSADVTSIDPSLVDGNDWLEGGLGDDLIDGGGGTDWASFVNASGSEIVVLGDVTGSASGADGEDTLSNIENVVGSAFDDTIIGNSGDNWLDGYAGNDVLRGRDGNDTVFGNDGNDFLNGGAGNDVIDGGNGFDRATYYTGATAGVTVDLNQQGVAQNTGQGMDTLLNIENVSGTAFGDILIGDSGDNWLWGSTATLPDSSISPDNNDTLDGGDGNDLLMVGIGNHSLTGGSGTDTVAFTENGAAEPGLTVSLELQGIAQATGAGSWTLNGIENLSGGIANDTLTGDGGENVLAGDTGNDSLAGGAGNDTLYGDGRIGIDYAGGPGTSGPIATWADVTTLDPTLTDGDDTLEGGLGDDMINGGGGIDTASYANASGGVQVVLGAVGGSSTGADGEDTLLYIENVTGSAFDDSLTGNNGDNVVAGGDGHDLLYGRSGNDTLLGGNGDDLLRGDLGNDVLDGGAGWDRASFFLSTATTGVQVDLNIQGVAQDTGRGMDTLIGIEHATGTTFGDVLIGDGGDNWLFTGSDGVAGGGSGNDTISGNGGNDLIEVGAGNHTITGGTGIDTWSLFGGQSEISAAGVTVSLALQGAAQDTEQGMMNASGFENLSGSLYDDNLTGDAGNNVIAGDTGNDSLVGGDGSDTLYGDGRISVDTHGVGGSGPITTWGDVTAIDASLIDGNDTLVGGKGNDTLHGGGGDDVLTGSQGNDRFVIEDASGDDRVTDFAHSDRIVFDPSSGVTAFSQLTLTQVGGDTLVTWGTSDSILIEGLKPKQLSAGDFDFGSAAITAFSFVSAADMQNDAAFAHSGGAAFDHLV